VKRDDFLILLSSKTTFQVVFLALPMSYRKTLRIGFEPTTEEVGRRMSANIATSNTHHGTRVPDAPQRLLYEVHGAQSRAVLMFVHGIRTHGVMRE